MATTKVKPRHKQSVLVENIKTIVYAGLIAVVVRTFLFEPFNIPSGSMLPTLDIGDYLFVSKYSYGYSRYSFLLDWPDFPGRIFGRLPRVGDVVVFRFPRDPSIDYIKRIIALPGQTVQMREGQLYIDGKLVPRQSVGNYTGPGDNGLPMVYQKYVETLPDGVKHPELKTTDDGPANNTELFTVPPGHVFVMGDNRDDSADSRFPELGVGYVPIQNLVGRADLIFFSIDSEYPWWEVWEWPFEVRWDRLMTIIH